CSCRPDALSLDHVAMAAPTIHVGTGDSPVQRSKAPQPFAPLQSHAPMDPTADIEIRPATNQDATAILKCLAAAFEPYRKHYSPPAFTDTVLTNETVHVRLQQMHVLLASVAGNVV